MAASILCCCCCWGFHVSARNGLWQISAVSGTGVELWSGPCLAATEVKWQSIDWEDGRLKNPGQECPWARSRTLASTNHDRRPLEKQDVLHTHFTYVHTESPYKDAVNNHTHTSLRYEELLVSNHPRLFPIITISFNNNTINWQDEILR